MTLQINTARLGRPSLRVRLREALALYRQYGEQPSTMPPAALRTFVDVTAEAVGAGIDVPAFVAAEDATANRSAA